jgi:hypothetical protein
MDEGSGSAHHPKPSRNGRVPTRLAAQENAPLKNVVAERRVSRYRCAVLRVLSILKTRQLLSVIPTGAGPWSEGFGVVEEPAFPCWTGCL